MIYISHQISIDEKYMGLHYKTCDHVVPLGQFKLNDLNVTENGLSFTSELIPFQELHDEYIKKYKETGDLRLYEKAKEMLKIASGEIELKF
jgi:hypothetical protein